MNNGASSALKIKTNSVRAWWLAARPKTLTGAIAPVLMGGAMAFSMLHAKTFGIGWHIDWQDPMVREWLLDVLVPFFLCLLFAVMMQIDANFINDYFDFKKGTDRTDRLGPERACAQGWITPHAMRIGIGVATLLSCLVGVSILLWHMQWELLIVGALCVAFCFLYTTRLSYMGWGDVLVLVFFGLVPVVFTYYVMTNGGWNIPLVIAGLAMGLATDNLLMVNNYRDRHQDKQSGKRTIVVRIMDKQIRQLGDEAGTKEAEQICRDFYMWIGIFSTILSFTSLFLFPLSTIRYPLMIVYLILHFRAFRQLNTLDGRELNKVLATTARNIFLFGLLFAIGVFL
ncbi:MAG: 1,4-dihydroxy-2-naphthoate octaprenyltransferase [Prevotellaceae bacterium]|nr:1,4-dihydroxy-2-naphthoate octaprenyltransferase [Prevotellaceae bacterium]